MLTALMLSALLFLPALGESWSEQAKLVPSDGGSGDNFGLSVSLDGDAALIGALFDDDLGTDSGSSYVYRFVGGSWIEDQKLHASDGEALDRFGRGVSLCGDVAVVGAYRNGDAGLESGSAYIFRHIDGTWSEAHKITASDASEGDRFGCNVSASGNAIIVGAYRDGDLETGSAYVFRFDGARWIEEQKLLADVPTAYDYYGFSVSLSGNTAIVGCECDDDRGVDSGSASVYRYDGAHWVRQAKLTASDGSSGDLFGHFVSISGNVALIGAYGNDDAGSQSGSAYVFRYDGTTWVEERKLVASDAAAGDSFGWNVSVSGDLALVGAQWNADSGEGSGSSYVFRRVGGTWVEEAKLTPSDGAAMDLFGYAGSVSGDRVLVGALGDDTGGVTSGSAYVFSSPAVSDIAGPSTDSTSPDGELRVDPNPASGAVKITIPPSTKDATCITIHDATGRRIRVFEIPIGHGTMIWDGDDERGRRLEAGAYFLTASTRDRSHVRRVVLLR